MLEEHKSEERDPDLQVEDFIMFYDYRQNHWKDVIEQNHEYGGGINSMMQDDYIKYQYVLIKREVLMEVPHLKGDDKIQTCVGANVIK